MRRSLPATCRRCVRVRAAQGVVHCVIPAVEVGNFAAVRALAHAAGDSYALGIHPLFVPQAADGDLQLLDQALAGRASTTRAWWRSARSGWTFSCRPCATPAMRERQEHFYLAQLRLARKHGLPVILHVRRSADRLLRGLRALAPAAGPRWSGIAHAFAGSRAAGGRFVDLGFKLGFGGAVTFERALQLRRLAVGPAGVGAGAGDRCARHSAALAVHDVPHAAPPERPSARNEPAQLPAIAPGGGRAARHHAG